MPEQKNETLTIGQRVVELIESRKRKAASRLEDVKARNDQAQTHPSSEVWKQLAQSADPFGDKK